MLEWIKKGLKKTSNVKKSIYVWNTTAGILSALQSVVILMVVSRTNGLYDAGVFSIAYAVASLMIFIGQYGIRKYQASDVRETFTFGEYYGQRLITCLMMLAAILVYCAYGAMFKGYHTDKCIVVFFVCLLKLVQAMTDVFHGRLQQCGRLDIGAKSACARIICSTGSCCICLVLTHDLVISSIVFAFFAFLLFMLTTVNVSRDYCTVRPQFNREAMRKLFITGFPLFVSTFLSMYIGNAPKYAIDSYLSEEIQAYYNYIFMPVFAVQMLSNFIFNPILNTYAKIWVDHEFTKFRRAVRRQMLAILGITVLGLAVAATIGIPILSLLFGSDLSDYKLALIIVMAGGGALAYVTFFTTVITIIRHQNVLMVGYGVISLAALLLSKFFVTNYGIMGAATMYSILMGALAAAFFILMTWQIRTDIKYLEP
ncbi:MAG: lipopolysaccharide biosynthesis protein [Anaerovoracaceae bacterium]|jgi:O-antigen/teichoic acid export membrane protein